MTLPTAVLSQAGKCGGSARKHHYTDEEREIIRRDYQHTHQSRRDIAVRLGVTEFGVAGQIAKMGICKCNGRRTWTQKEKDILCDLIGKYAPITIARRMKRSVNSVVVMAKRMGLSRRCRDGWYTEREVCQILGVDHHFTRKHIESGELKATYYTDIQPTNKSGAMWRITEHDLEQFIRKNAFRLNGRNVDLLVLVDLLCGVISE